MRGFGDVAEANPTHQANMHFFWIYHWMKQTGIEAGEMDMVFDCEDLTTCIGSFGVGLAQGLMKNVWTLPNLQVGLPGVCLPLTLLSPLTFIEFRAS